MKSILKYRIPVHYEFVQRLPKDSQILSVAEQAGEIMLWAIVEDDPKEFENHTIMVLPTGFSHFEIPFHRMQFLGTVTMPKTQLVWHVFRKVVTP